MTRKVRIAFLGFGGVGRAFAAMLESKRLELMSQYGIEPLITAISDAYLGSVFDATGIDPVLLNTLPIEKGGMSRLNGGNAEAKNDRIFSQNIADVLVEVSFTNPVDGQPAKSFCEKALAEGMTVITSNKGPVAFGVGQDEADRQRFFCEGAVMSGTPVLSLLRETLPLAEIQGVRGIFNGTSNYVLGRMAEGEPRDVAIRAAQELGYAEADPTADIEGHDVVMKLIILARFVLNVTLKPEEVKRTGISAITDDDLQQAKDSGRRWKLIGRIARRDNGQLDVSVAPEAIEASDPLFGVNGAINAIAVDTEELGELLMTGPGAGLRETAYALLSDLVFACGEIK